MTKTKSNLTAVCAVCGTIFPIWPFEIRKGRRTCSKPCKVADQTGRKEPLLNRYNRYVLRFGDDECWPWIGSLDRKGYGQINDGNGKPIKAHRIALSLKLKRPLTNEEWSLHTCDYPPCQNPSHLYSGGPIENVRDMHERGRASMSGARGERNARAKLTAGDIGTIRAALNRGERGADLAAAYGVTTAAISAIKHRRVWRHVSD